MAKPKLAKIPAGWERVTRGLKKPEYKFRSIYTGKFMLYGKQPDWAEYATEQINSANFVIRRITPAKKRGKKGRGE